MPEFTWKPTPGLDRDEANEIAISDRANSIVEDRDGFGTILAEDVGLMRLVSRYVAREVYGLRGLPEVPKAVLYSAIDQVARREALKQLEREAPEALDPYY